MQGKLTMRGEVALKVNGQRHKKSDVDKLIWDTREQIADLSFFYHQPPGDLLFTGTPEGMAPVVAGDRLPGA